MSTDISNASADDAKAAFLALNSKNNAKAPRGAIPHKVKELISYLPDGEYVTQSTLAEFINCSGGRIHSLMEQLVNEHVVRLDKSNKPFRYYRL